MQKSYREVFWNEILRGITFAYRDNSQEIVVSRKHNPSAEVVWDYVRRRVDAEEATSFDGITYETRVDGVCMYVIANINEKVRFNVRFSYAMSKQGKVSINTFAHLKNEEGEFKENIFTKGQIEGVLSEMFKFCKNYTQFLDECAKYSFKCEYKKTLREEILKEIDPIIKKQISPSGMFPELLQLHGGFFDDIRSFKFTLLHEEKKFCLKKERQEQLNKENYISELEKEALNSFVHINLPVKKPNVNKIEYIFSDRPSNLKSNSYWSFYLTYEFSVREFKEEKKRILSELAAIIDFLNIFVKRNALKKQGNFLKVGCKVRTGFFSWSTFIPEKVIINNKV